MVHWFNPILLGKLLLKVIVSDTFGQYADKRLLEAALDSRADLHEHLARADLTERIAKTSDGAIWLDYISDLGEMASTPLMPWRTCWLRTVCQLMA